MLTPADALSEFRKCLDESSEACQANGAALADIADALGDLPDELFVAMVDGLRERLLLIAYDHTMLGRSYAMLSKLIGQREGGIMRRGADPNVN